MNERNLGTHLTNHKPWFQRPVLVLPILGLVVIVLVSIGITSRSDPTIARIEFVEIEFLGGQQDFAIREVWTLFFRVSNTSKDHKLQWPGLLNTHSITVSDEHGNSYRGFPNWSTIIPNPNSPPNSKSSFPVPRNVDVRPGQSIVDAVVIDKPLASAKEIHLRINGKELGFDKEVLLILPNPPTPTRYQQVNPKG